MWLEWITEQNDSRVVLHKPRFFMDEKAAEQLNFLFNLMIGKSTQLDAAYSMVISNIIFTKLVSHECTILLTRLNDSQLFKA